MKINEAVNIINGNATVRAKVKAGELLVFDRKMSNENLFLIFPTNTIYWHKVIKNWDGLNSVEPHDLARVMDVIQRLLNTPVNERFPEKKYVLRWIDDEIGKTFLGFCKRYGQKYWSTFDTQTSSTVFTESELEQLKKDNPRLAPAIDAMKEEVKGDED